MTDIIGLHLFEIIQTENRLVVASGYARLNMGGVDERDYTSMME